MFLTDKVFITLATPVTRGGKSVGSNFPRSSSGSSSSMSPNGGPSVGSTCFPGSSSDKSPGGPRMGPHGGVRGRRRFVGTQIPGGRLSARQFVRFPGGRLSARQVGSPVSDSRFPVGRLSDRQSRATQDSSDTELKTRSCNSTVTCSSPIESTEI